MKNIRVTILRQGLLEMQICCNLTPKEMSKRKKEAEKLLPLAGSTTGWLIELEDERYAPVACDDDAGYWHYIAFC